MKLYILIGGSQHGTVQQFDTAQSVYRYVKPKEFTGEIRPADAATLDFATEDYHVRRVGMPGTKRRANYLVLASLSDEEGLRLINEYESTNDDTPTTTR